ncbi:MAG: S9 family peptidase [Vicinamibacterales bacterium]|jgi:dipeptidyl aminopeptidase/acylaminoacyl peptidase|nr:peptidase S9 [Acidobacteriota bacterium]MDP6371155.1 S9 family peptidase [Vicinamibacterales bacterium]MDP6610402.1 S9 family peptidase [Vicinamibacterales bacterium]HAK54148.1 S9 family peptidase [Acidobacteriota bacterium]
MTNRVLSLVLAGAVLYPAVALAQSETRKLDLATYLDFESVTDPRLSPDGRQVVYTRQWFDKMNDRRESSLWIVNRDGSRNRFLIDGSSPRWSPSGDRIAFVASGEPEGRQVFVRWMDDEGAVTQITRVDKGPSNIAWAPDGSRIAFTMMVDDKTNWSIDLPSRPEGATWTASPKIVERLRYRQDGVGYIDEGWRHIFVVPADGGTARQVTDGGYNHSNVEWTPDGEAIVFSGLRLADAEYRFRESEIYSVEIASGSVTQLTDREGPDQQPKVSPDGAQIAYTGYDWTRDSWIDSKLYVMDVNGSNARLISGDWDRSPRNVRWSADGGTIYFTAQNEGTQNLYRIAADGGPVTSVTEGTHTLTVTDINDAGQAVGVLTDFNNPTDVVAFDLTSPAMRDQLTHVNDDILDGVAFGETTEVWYTAPDGVRVQGWYLTPPDFDPNRTYPLQLHIHGGPHSMYGARFNYGWQEHVANDYVVLFTNPRGSTGYGSAFGNMIADAYPGPDYQDLMAGVDTMLETGFIDPENLFVTGCSGGGILTAWIVTKTDRFAAASSNCTIVDWMSTSGTTDILPYYRFPQLPWEDPTLWIAHSSIFHVGSVTTPTMLITGEDDLRTPITQAEQFYRALKFRKVPTALLRYNNQSHGTGSRPSNFMRTQLYLRQWFEKYGTTGDRMTDAGQ